MTSDTKSIDNDIDVLFSVGAQYGYSRSKRHPSTGAYIFGVKNNVEIFDLEKTQKKFDDAIAFVRSIGADGKTILFVSGKAESKQAIHAAHEKTSLPYVTGRWIGGTLTNFEIIRKRVDRLVDIRTKQEKGGLEQYTKLERLMMQREAERLAHKFDGIVSMEKRPDVLFVVDSRQEDIAVREAHHLGIPVVALASSDCDLTHIEYPIPANDSNIKSISFFVDSITTAYMSGLKDRSVKAAAKADAKPEVRSTKSETNIKQK